MKNSIDQTGLTNIHGTFHRQQQNTFFSRAHATFSRVDHMLEHRTSCSKFKNREIISGTFSDYNGMKLEINENRKAEKVRNTGKLSHMLLDNNGSAKKEYFGTIKNGRSTY